MKNSILTTLCLILSLSSLAQNNNISINTLALKVEIVNTPESFPNEAATHLYSKLNYILTQNGITSTDIFNRFFLAVVPVSLTQNIVPGAPTRIAQNIEFTFYIADYTTQTIYSSTSVKAKGIGTNTTKSLLDAVSNINTNSTQFKDFVERGRQKIISYYDQEASKLIAQAQSLAKQKEFEAALFLLTDIPTDCQQYDKYIQAINDIYQQYIDYTCNANLHQAKALWMSAQDAIGAMQAGEHLASIMPEAACYDDAVALYNEIKSKVLDEWKFEMKKYQDGVDIEKQRIEAARAVGIAFGKGQQPSTTNLSWLH